MSESSIEKIMLMLGEIRGDIKGVHTRLDTLNGKTKETAGRVDDLESTRDQNKGSWKVVAIVSGVISTAVTMVARKLL